MTADTYLIFNRYRDCSIKEFTLSSRAGKLARREHELTMNLTLQPQKVCLAVTRNEIQIINLICEYLEHQCETPLSGSL